MERFRLFHLSVLTRTLRPLPPTSASSHLAPRSKPRPLPDDVQRVMPNGSWLMRDGSIRPASDGEKR